MSCARLLGSRSLRLSDLILITGGAGFIGSHLADELLEHGYRVRAFDSLECQVHENAERYLSSEAELIEGDVRDGHSLRRALDGVDAVVHLAARVGVGQSMYEIAEYTAANTLGTAVLLEALVERPAGKLVVASSMSLYGEGAYRDADPGERTREQLERREWDFPGLEPVPTPETKRPGLTSIYALTKYDQERSCLICGDAYKIPTVALRFFNVYGPRQALSNPYTGVLAIFASRLLNDRAPRVFEDGLQRRDFVSVHDIARAIRLSVETDGANGKAVNVGSGSSASVLEIGETLAATLGKEIEPEVTGEYRVGDIRHCFADITLARTTLGYEPQVTFEAGMTELASWLEGQSAEDRVDAATAELTRRGLTG